MSQPEITIPLQESQPQAWHTLMAAVRSGRLHHAYVLSGQQVEQGVALARAVTAALVCTTPMDQRPGDAGQTAAACTTCPACRKLAGDNHPDVIMVAPDDKGVIRIGTIRDLAQRLSLRAVEAHTKVVLITRADQMNVPAQNALLKTLEEPPGPSCFFLVTRRYRALLPTVRSRSQRVRLAPVDHATATTSLLAAGIDEALAPRLAALCGADVAQAEKLLDQGCGEVLETLRRALRPGARASDILDVASDLGSDRARADLALSILEIEMRDRLAKAHGAHRERLYDPQSPPARSQAEVWAIERLWELRRHQAFHLNRTLALEGLLLELAADAR